jgi:hypothetical protein
MLGMFIGENLIFCLLAYDADLRFEGRSQSDICARAGQDGRSVHLLVQRFGPSMEVSRSQEVTARI